MLKKLALAVVALAISAPAFADDGRRDYRHGHKAKRYVVKEHYYPVMERYQYRPAPRRVVVVHHQPQPVYYQAQPVYYQAQPVYYQPHPNAGAALVVGAVLGAAIAHHVVTSSY